MEPIQSSEFTAENPPTTSTFIAMRSPSSPGHDIPAKHESEQVEGQDPPTQNPSNPPTDSYPVQNPRSQALETQDPDCNSQQQEATVVVDEQDPEDQEGMAFSPSHQPLISDTHVEERDNYPPLSSSRRAPSKRKRGFAKNNPRKMAAIEKKVQALTQNFKAIPFVPCKALDFSRYEEQLRRLGLWDFAQLEFDRKLRDDLVAKLIVGYNEKSRCSHIDNVRIMVNQADLARALKLSFKKAVDCGEETWPADFVSFVDDFVSNWMLLHEDTWILPPEVVNWTGVIKDGHPEKVDWARLIWFMVKRELSKGTQLANCYYASHLQHLIKVQKEELLKEDPNEVDEIMVLKEDDEEEEGDVKMAEDELSHGGEHEMNPENMQLHLGQKGGVGIEDVQSKNSVENVESKNSVENVDNVDGLGSAGDAENVGSLSLGDGTADQGGRVGNLESAVQPDHVKNLESGDHLDKLETADDHVDKPDTADDHLDKPDTADDHVEKPETADDHVDKPDTADDHVDKPDTADDHVEKLKTADDHVEKQERADVHVEKPETTDDHVEKQERADVHVEKPETPDDHVDKHERADDHVEIPETPDDHVEKLETADDHVEKPETAGDHVDKPETAGDHVDKPETAGDHVGKRETAGDHVEKPEPAGDHVGKPETAGDHVGKRETAGDHVDKPKTAGDRVDEPETAGDRVDEPETADDRVDEPETADDRVDKPEIADGRVDKLEIADGHVDKLETAGDHVENMEPAIDLEEHMEPAGDLAEHMEPVGDLVDNMKVSGDHVESIETVGDHGEDMKIDDDVDNADHAQIQRARDDDMMDFEDCKAEEQGQWDLSGKDGEQELFLRHCSMDGVKVDEEQTRQDGQDEEVEDDEAEDDEHEEQVEGFDTLQKCNSFNLSSGHLLQTIEQSQIPYPSDFGDQSSLELMSSRVENHVMLGGPSIFGNASKREIDHESDISNHSLNDNHKRMRTEGPSWDHKPPDFDLCFDQIQQWVGKARMAYVSSQQASMNQQQLLFNELATKEHNVQQLRSDIEVLHKRRQAELARYDNELYAMNSVISGYRRALKSTQQAFAEYRKRSSLPTEPLYKDAGDGGVVKSIMDLEKERLKREEEERLDRIMFTEMVEKFGETWTMTFEGHLERLEMYQARVSGIEQDVKLLKESMDKRKAEKTTD